MSRQTRYITEYDNNSISAATDLAPNELHISHDKLPITIEHILKLEAIKAWMVTP